MKYLFLIAVAFVFQAKSMAQTKQKIAFASYNSIGFVTGKLPIEFVAQTEVGISIKNWFFGAGFGIDKYFLTTLPLYFAVKNNIHLKTNKLFLYANAGTNFIEKDKRKVNTYSIIENSGGFFADGGIGYKIKTSKKGNIFISIGNTFKIVTQTETSTDTGFPYSYFTKNKLSNISFKIGFNF